QPRDSQEIASGFATTAADGSFKVTFTARPDLSVPAKDEPTFHYTVHADVTDTTGETRSGSASVNVGYTALNAELTVPQWLTTARAVEVTARTTTLDGEGQAVEGTVKVHRLKAPETVQRAPLRDRYYHPMPVMHRGREKEPEPDLSN